MSVINYLLEWLTGTEIDPETLGHFRFIAEMFGLTAKVREMCKSVIDPGTAGALRQSRPGRAELCG
jgi:hypothetical protein